MADPGDGTDDELLSGRLTSHETPRRASARSRHEEGLTSRETPYASLKGLAGVVEKPSTPHFRGTAFQSGGRTPGTLSRVNKLKKPPRPVPAKVGAPSTPHAIRAMQQRRAAVATTPARERRRSGRQQRETPRDILRNLSRVLSKNSVRPPVISPETRRPKNIEPPENDFDLPKPRFSLPIDEEDDDSFQAPPRLSSTFDDDTHTQMSIEVPRRALVEGSASQLYTRLRLSDNFTNVMQDISPDVRVDQSQLEIDFDNDTSDEHNYRRGYVSGEDGVLPEHEVPHFNQSIGEEDSTFAFNIPPEAQRDDHSQTDESSSDDNEGHELSPIPHHGDNVSVAALRDGEEPRRRTSKPKHISAHGIPFQTLPPRTVKKLAESYGRSIGSGKHKINKDILKTVVQASDWFFEQIASDLGVYADHASRKTLEDTDVVTLMKRQRILTASATPFSVALKHLPRELLKEIQPSARHTGR